MGLIIDGILAIIAIGAIVIALYAIIAFVIMLLWNYVFGAIYPIHFWQALVLWFLANLLFKGDK